MRRNFYRRRFLQRFFCSLRRKAHWPKLPKNTNGEDFRWDLALCCYSSDSSTSESCQTNESEVDSFSRVVFFSVYFCLLFYQWIKRGSEVSTKTSQANLCCAIFFYSLTNVRNANGSHGVVGSTAGLRRVRVRIPAFIFTINLFLMFWILRIVLFFYSYLKYQYLPVLFGISSINADSNRNFVYSIIVNIILKITRNFPHFSLMVFLIILVKSMWVQSMPSRSKYSQHTNRSLLRKFSSIRD